MTISWTSTIFTLIAAAIVILIICGVVLLVKNLSNARKRLARIEGKIDRVLEQKPSDKSNL